MFINSLYVRYEIFGFEVLGSLFWIIVKNIVMVKRMVIENFIFLLDFMGNIKIKIWMKFMKKIGNSRFVM